MGLLMVGIGSDKANEMLTYAHETQHEKIIRGLALGIALTIYGRKEEADTLIEKMIRDQDPILRYDDVRRITVLAFGFVLYSDPKQVPWILSGTVRDNILFGKSYDPERIIT